MRCADFYKRWEQEPNWCEKTPGAVSQINSYLDLVKEIASRGINREKVYEKFPEGAARVIKEDDHRAELLNYVIACLNRNEKITAGDLKKFTFVKAYAPFPMEKTEVPPAPIARTLKEKFAPKEQPAPIKELPPQLSSDAPMDEVLKRDEVLLAQVGFVPASDYDPLTGGKIVRGPPIKIIHPPQVIQFTPTEKQWEFIREVMEGSDFETPEQVVSECVDRARESEWGK